MSRSRSPHVPELHRPPLAPASADRRPRPADDELAELRAYADPDCTECRGAGSVGWMPCDLCMVGVWL